MAGQARSWVRASAGQSTLKQAAAVFDDDVDVDEAEEENRGPSVEFLAKGWKRERISHL